MKLNQFMEIKSQADMDQFVTSCKGFHDSLIKELHMVNSAYVNSDFSMSMYFKLNLRLLIQTQWSDAPSIEVIMSDVRNLTIKNDAAAIWGGNGTFLKSKVNDETEITLSLDENKFCCSRLFYRITPDFLGKESRFGEEIQIETSDDIEWLDQDWVICRKCCESWKPGNRQVLVCPKCGE